ncbi:MAG: phosphoenolpyruvate--protein phosphotransferase [Treponema sp.]|nr:phosphoenolpyruvate--protein phosphotransferase [Treponema sp.]
MKKHTGNPVSPGIVVGKAFVYLESSNETPDFPRYNLRKNQLETEWRRFLAANDAALIEVRTLYQKAKRDMSKQNAAIFEAHTMMLEDTDFQDQLKDRLRSTLQNIEWVINDVAHDLTSKLMVSPDAYMRERAIDINDVLHRVMNKLLAVQRVSLADLDDDVILVCHELLPSDMIAMSRDHVKGIVTELGGPTSHTAILARAYEIPSVMGITGICLEISNGESLSVNGVSGEVIIELDKAALVTVQSARGRYYRGVAELGELRDVPAETKDGCRVCLKANIELPDEADNALRSGCDGIGLYRSEFLFLVPGKPTEEAEQFSAYSHVLQALGQLPVTLRTSDSGGDKLLPDFQSPNERNPILGWRAIRFSLTWPELFKVQLRAMLRASVYGNLKIMFPMISGIEELEQAHGILEEAKDELRQRGEAFVEDIPVGTMIEVPSAAMTAEILAERSDFFSIGTNDLIQYTMAVDRANERVSYLAQPFHPAILRFLKRTIDAAHDKGIVATMCGEMAGDARAVPLLLGMGLDEFSMSIPAIPLVKRVIRSATLTSCKQLAVLALACTSYRDVDRLVDDWMQSELGIIRENTR